MGITFTQPCGGGTAYTVPTNGTGSGTASGTFTSNNTAGNSIVVFVFGNLSGAASSASTPVVTDTAGNTYTQVFMVFHGNTSGGWIGMYITQNILGGANTVNWTATVHAGFAISATVTQAVIAIEYSGMPSPSVISFAHNEFFGTAGNSPSVLNLTDSFGMAVTINAAANGSVSSSIGAAVIFSGGVNYIVAASQSNFNPLAAPTSAYQLFQQELFLNKVDGTFYDYYWDYGVPGPNTITQSQVSVMT